jgi:hypothetical protein
MQLALALLIVGIAALASWWRRTALPASVRISFIVCAALLALYTFTRPAAAFSGDEGVKLVQALAIERGQIALTYSAQDLDPGRDAFPLQPPFALVHGGAHYGIYAITFTAPAAAAHAVFGFWGLHVVPLLGGLLALWSMLRLADRVLGSARWTIACGVALLITPLALNAALFNEHAPAAGLMLFAVAQVALGGTCGRGLLVAGGALGLAITMRLELVAVVPAVAAFTISCATGTHGAVRSLVWLAVGGLIPGALYAAVNHATLGVVSPMLHPSYLATFEGSRNADLAPRDLGAVTGIGKIVLLWLVALGFVTSQRPWLAWLRVFAIVGVLGVWSYAIVVYLRSPTTDDFAAGLFFSTPLLALGLALGPRPIDPGLARDGGRVAGALWCLAVAGTACMMVLNPLDGGLRAGARYVVPLMPLWAILAVTVARQHRVLAATAFVVAGLGCWPQLESHRLVQETRERNAATLSDIRAIPDRAITSRVFWALQVVAPLWHERAILTAGRLTPAMLDALQASGEEAIIEIVSGLGSMTAAKVDPAYQSTSGRVKRYRFVQR